MRTVRALIRRVPAGPVIIALLMVGILTLVNLYGTNGTAEHAAPSEPVGIPPQLPAEEHGVPSPSGTTDASPAPTPAPSASVSAADVPAPRSGNPPASTRPASPTPPQQGAGIAPPQQGSGTSGQDSQGNDDGRVTPSGPRLQVVGAVLTVDHAAGSYVRCSGRDEVVIAATILVDGGPGSVVYQWVFDGSRAWPPDLLQFTGTGKRQQSLQIPWPVGIKYSGARVKGTVQLRILQPVLDAQTQRTTIDVTCI